ncbi:MAG TPA: hypothetical protein PKO17_06195 [Pseudomonadales bacterium]|nr:hypothetical protein [Pseudomonadales bacterium]
MAMASKKINFALMVILANMVNAPLGFSASINSDAAETFLQFSRLRGLTGTFCRRRSNRRQQFREHGRIDGPTP